jgi:hypothetical protein
MQYALLIYTAPQQEAPSEEEMALEMKAYNEFTQEIVDKGVMQGGEALDAIETATTVRVRNGELATVDGPFAETKEVLGGFYLVDCADLDEAIGYAAKIPAANYGSIEVRPIWNVPEEYRAEG